MLELNRDDVVPGERILIVDDLLATGGMLMLFYDALCECLSFSRHCQGSMHAYVMFVCVLCVLFSAIL